MKKFYFLIAIILYSFASSLKAQINLLDGLVAYYPLNGNANDVSGNGNNGVLIGGTPAQDRLGNDNSAISFNGISTYILTPIYSGFTNQISLCAWAKTATSNYSGIVCSRYGNNMAALITIDNFGQPFAHLSDGNPSNLVNTSVGAIGINLNDDKWHFIVVTFDGTNRRMYVDGILKNQLINYSFNLFIQSPFKIGWDDLPGYQRFFNGKIDDVRIYKRSLNKSEVFQLFKDGVCNCTIKNDTTSYVVVSENFKSIGPVVNYLRSDSLKTKVRGCDSIITQYAKFIYDPNSSANPKNNTVTDTLIINVTVTVNNSLISNLMKLYPNPTKDFLNIDFGDYNNMSGYLVAIRNETGNTVFLTSITQKSSIINIKNWAKGVYIVQIIDKSSAATIETKKIIIR